MKDRGYLFVAGLIVLGILADVGLNQSRATLYLIHDIISLQEYLQFWH